MLVASSVYSASPQFGLRGGGRPLGIDTEIYSIQDTISDVFIGGKKMMMHMME